MCFFSFCFATQVEVSADKFTGNESGGFGKFLGNVIVTKGNDTLKSDKLIISFNKKRKPTKYEASGNASIKVFIDKKEYVGRGDSLIYDPIENIYTISGNAFFEERTSNKKVYGEKIVVNQKNGKYDVTSKKNKPVKFIFEVENKSIKSIKK